MDDVENYAGHSMVNESWAWTEPCIYEQFDLMLTSLALAFEFSLQAVAFRFIGG